MSRRGWMLFAVMSVLWGVPYLLIKVAVGEVSAPVLVFARTAIGAAVLLPVAIRRGWLRRLRPYWGWLLLFSGCEILGPWFLLSDAEQELSSSMTGLMIAAVPIFGALLGLLVGGAERLGPVRWIGLALGFGGVALLAAPSLGGGDAWSVTQVLLTALGYAAAPMMAERKLKDVPPLTMTAVCLGVAALFYAPFAALTWPQEVPSAKALTAIGVLALVCTALAFLTFLALIREVGSSRAVVFTYVNPAVAVAAGVLLLNESLSRNVIGAFVLILGGSVLATRPGTKKSPTETVSRVDSAAWQDSNRGHKKAQR
jgi:drug/metabolite transporter (DMT)-like permease